MDSIAVDICIAVLNNLKEASTLQQAQCIASLSHRCKVAERSRSPSFYLNYLYIPTPRYVRQFISALGQVACKGRNTMKQVLPATDSIARLP